MLRLISDPTKLDLTNNFFVLRLTDMKVYLYTVKPRLLEVPGTAGILSNNP